MSSPWPTRSFFLPVCSLTFPPSHILPWYRPEQLLLSASESNIYSQHTEGWSHGTDMCCLIFTWVLMLACQVIYLLSHFSSPLCDCISAAFSETRKRGDAETLSLPDLLSMALLTFVPVIAKVLALLEVAGMLYICYLCLLLSAPEYNTGSYWQLNAHHLAQDLAHYRDCVNVLSTNGDPSLRYLCYKKLTGFSNCQNIKW